MSRDPTGGATDGAREPGDLTPAHSASGRVGDDAADSLLFEIVQQLAPGPAAPPWDRAALDGAVRFRIDAQLGKGGVGVVFRAYDTVLGRAVALKLLRERKPATIARFVREARAQARIEHEHVCKVYDVGELAGAPFIAMQLVHGETLDRVRAQMSMEERVRVMKQVADGVHAAHRIGLIHRDVKPQNILVERTPRGELWPYVTDFGLVRDGEEQTLTLTGQALGTPPYMSPEQVRCEELDRRTDVYALGATLYHALVGGPPFSGATPAEVLARVLETEPEPVRRRNPRVPADLEAIAMRCLEKQPQDRYASAHELAQDLQRYLDGEPVLARRGGVLARCRRAIRRHRLVSAVVATGVLALVATIASLQILARREVDARISHLWADAQQASVQGDVSAARARALHDRMAAAFSTGGRTTGEAIWHDELAASAAANHSYADAARSLEAAIAIDPVRADLRARFADLLLQRALLAERYHRMAERDDLIARLELYDADQERLRFWRRPAHLSLAITPPTASVEIERYVEDARGDLRPEPAGPALRSLDAVALAPGSYLVTLSGAGLATVHYPVALTRGESLRVAVDVPSASAVPDGFVYVPPGRFLFGSALDEDYRQLLAAPPMHEERTDGYLIATHEVTTAEFIEYLAAQPGPGRGFRSEPLDNEHAVVRQLRPGMWEYHYDFATLDGYTARTGEEFRYRHRREHAVQDWMRFPIVGLSALDAEAYVAWLARTRIPGARLCAETEWERAARGADGREYPHGQRLAPGDADFAETYVDKVDTGPDEVGLHPASRSVFGLEDVAGNAWEYTRSVLSGDRYVVRGGSFPNAAIYLRCATRGSITPTFRGAHHGLRVCAPAPAR